MAIKVKINISPAMQTALLLLVIVVSATCFAFATINPVEAFLKALDYYGPVVPILFWVIAPIMGYWGVKSDDSSAHSTKPKKKR